MTKIAILYSGGLDSFILYHMAKAQYPKADVVCVFYDHGQDSVTAEIAALPDFVHVRKVDWLNVQNNAQRKESDPFAGPIYIPGRNLVFSTLVACQELPDEIWMGTMFDEDNEGATDKNETFRRLTGRVLQYVLSPFQPEGVKIRFPFVEQQMTKSVAINWAINNEVTEEELKSTTSCWHNKTGTQCGKCKQCLKRWLAMRTNGIYEDFEVDPIENQQEVIQGYVDYYNKGKANMDERVMATMILEQLYKNEDGVWVSK